MAVRYKQGGLFRCCIETMHRNAENRTDQPHPGETLQCDACPDKPSHNMTYQEDYWEWTYAGWTPEQLHAKFAGETRA